MWRSEQEIMVRGQRSGLPKPLILIRWPRILVVLGLVLIVLLGEYAAMTLLVHSSNAAATPADQQTAVPSCGFQDPTFCPAAAATQHMVATADAGGLVEQQAVVPVRCAGAEPAQPYCRGVQAGEVVHAFRVYVGTQTRLMMRNQYIAVCGGYLRQHAPFRLVATETNGGGARMDFRGADGAQFRATFIKRRGVWYANALYVDKPAA